MSKGVSERSITRVKEEMRGQEPLWLDKSTESEMSKNNKTRILNTKRKWFGEEVGETPRKSQKIEKLKNME